MAWRAPAEAAGAGEPPPRGGAFSYPNYRRFWTASLVRVMGMQFHIFAVGWLVVDVLDRSPVWLGAVGFAQAIPTILLSVPAGAMADRIEHRRLLLVSQALLMVNYLVLAVLIMSGTATIWYVIVWAALTGCLSAIGNPAQNAILPRLIEMRAITSAVALMSAIWNGTRIIAPGLAGILIATVGVGEAFLAAAVAFALSVVLIATLKLTPMPVAQHGVDRSLLGGLRYVAGNRIFLAVVGLSFFSSMFGSSYLYLMPVFARDILDVGSTGYGILGGVGGTGALLGTLAVVRFGNTPYRGQYMLGSAALSGILVAGFASSTIFPLSLVMTFAAGFVASIYLNLGMTTLQVLVPDELRGRVMGVWSMTYFLTPVGAFAVGGGAEFIGTQAMVAIGGLSVTVFAAVLYAVSPELRNVPSVRPPARGGTAPATR
ncbi:MAG: MFS transporter [Dehalococcoidia bacterium]|nr:MFS transporter [Dehalococcoidia bacterium]